MTTTTVRTPPGVDFQPKTHSWEDKGWRVYTRKGPILNAREIDEMQDRLGIPVPEMIFGKNQVGIDHEASGFSMVFEAESALDGVDKTGADGLVQVAHSQAWLNSRQRKHRTSDAAGHKVEGIVNPYDWTYTTAYKGTASCEMGPAGDAQTIPFDKLKQPDPILFFDDVTLYEDELGDNGIVSLNVKVRVMPERLLILARMFLRVDGVLFRIRDTRVYVEFATNMVIREHQQHHGTYDDIKRRVPIGCQDYGPYLRDANWVSQRLTLEKSQREYVKL